MPSYGQQSSAQASFSGLPLGDMFRPITGYQNLGVGGGVNIPGGGAMNLYAQPMYGQNPVDPIFDWTKGAIGAQQQYAGSIDPAMFGYAGGAEADRMNATARGLQGLFNFNIPYAKQALRESFDPQKAFFQQNLADLQEQTRLGQSLRGVAMTPYAATSEASAVGRFINDWRDRQISRMLTGSQAAATLEQPVLASRQAAGDLFAKSAAARQAAAQMQLQAYGLKGDMLDRASKSLLSMLDALKIQQQGQASSERHESGGKE